MSKPFDATLKGLLEDSPEDWPVLAGYPPGETEVIDADVSTYSGAADKVLRVRGAPDWIQHVEFQAGPDASLPRRLHVGNTLLDDRQHLMVRSVVVLLRPEAFLANLTGVYERRFAGEAAHSTFRYTVLKVWELPVERLLRGGLGLLPLAPIADVSANELPGVIEQMKGRMRGRRARSEAPRLWTATYVLLGMRYSEGLAARLLEGITMMEESVTYQAIIRKGVAKGRVEGARSLLLHQAEVRFGRPSPAAAAAVGAIDDVDELDRLGERVLTASSWEDLLRGPSPSPRRRKRKP
jgi:predicted transposase YdaD